MLTCLVVVEMVRPGTPHGLYRKWKHAREREEAGPLYPCWDEHHCRTAEPSDYVRTWRGLPDTRDWERLVALKQRDSWGLVSHRREFIDTHQEIVERTEG